MVATQAGAQGLVMYLVSDIRQLLRRVLPVRVNTSRK